MGKTAEPYLRSNTHDCGTFRIWYIVDLNLKGHELK